MSARVVVMGMMGRTPVAGVAWQVLHYIEGFRRLGCDVHYVEDTGEWSYDPEKNTITDDPSYPVGFIGRSLAGIGLGDRWAYRSAAQDGRIYGLSEQGFEEVLSGADVLINLTGATVLREEHLAVPVRVYVETDPVQAQVEVAEGRPFTVDLLRAHTHHFSFGENLGTQRCPLPVGEFRYLPTRQPVVLDWWRRAEGARVTRPSLPRFTTIANWKQSNRDVEWRGETYSWSKHHEFLRFIGLPELAEGATFEIAVGGGEPAPEELLRSRGWRIRDGLRLSRDLDAYRNYIRASDAEFTVAKDQNVRLSTGWFSDRSACYLAAGRPVITQDTGFGTVLPVGRGLLAFASMEELLAAVDSVVANTAEHRRAAREIAGEYFSAEKVLGDLLHAVTTAPVKSGSP